MVTSGLKLRLLIKSFHVLIDVVVGAVVVVVVAVVAAVAIAGFVWYAAQN